MKADRVVLTANWKSESIVKILFFSVLRLVLLFYPSVTVFLNLLLKVLFQFFFSFTFVSVEQNHEEFVVEAHILQSFLDFLQGDLEDIGFKVFFKMFYINKMLLGSEEELLLSDNPFLSLSGCMFLSESLSWMIQMMASAIETRMYPIS